MKKEFQNHRKLLQDIARRVLLQQGLWPDFSRDVLKELERWEKAAMPSDSSRSSWKDLTGLLWASIDNDDSRDLDQLTVAQALPGDEIKVLVAVADVDSLVKENTAVDHHASHNTTSIYTAGEIFPMLPEKLSTNLTSLNYGEDRQAMVMEMVISGEGSLVRSDLYLAIVRNKAKLAYRSVAAWLDGSGEIPPAIAAVPGLDENLRLQDAAAQKMKKLRHSHGALSLETIEGKASFDQDQLVAMEFEESNRAKELIEDFMVTANGVTARFLASSQFPSLRRVVRMPRRWDRIIEIAREHGVTLPETPDSHALEEFLVQAREMDTIRFPDLSLSIIKLLGNGEYVAEPPDGLAPGHFGLAVKDYSHSTAPNRRYPDLITQRLLKAAIAGASSPYNLDELEELAVHCTEVEDVVNKIERQLDKSAAALLLESRVGEKFDAIVTGAADKGTWVRLLDLPVEGKLVSGYQGMDVGHRLVVRLVALDIYKGYIDFENVRKG